MSSSDPQQLERNKQVLRDFLVAVDSHDRDAFMRLVSPDHQLHFSGNAQPMNREMHWKMACAYEACFSDMRHTPLEQVAEGDRVVTRGEVTGRHTGPFNGIAPTGRTITAMFINISRVVNGQVCGSWALVDTNSVRDQLGVSIEFRANAA